MSDILKLPLVREYLSAATEIYRKGWAERNGGNISLILDGDFSELPVKASYPLGIDRADDRQVPPDSGAAAKYLKNVEPYPEESLALLSIKSDRAELLWVSVKAAGPAASLRPIYFATVPVWRLTRTTGLSCTPMPLILWR
jgi:rhamnulose-1-phosphate aldolase